MNKHPNPMRSEHLLHVVDLGRTRYAECWILQRRIFEQRREGLIGDTMLFTEHEHVYTLGKGADENHLLATEAELRSIGVDVFRIDRGGDITYHGPGQLVGYPIIDLNGYFNDIHRYLRELEETLITALHEFGLEGGREEGMTGVWIGGEKIAALGVKVSRWITMHGFALNVNTELSRFGRIIPCGIFHKGVTSMQTLLGKEIPMDDVKRAVAEAFSQRFHVPVAWMPADELARRLAASPIAQ